MRNKEHYSKIKIKERDRKNAIPLKGILIIIVILILSSLLIGLMPLKRNGQLEIPNSIEEYFTRVININLVLLPICFIFSIIMLLKQVYNNMYFYSGQFIILDKKNNSLYLLPGENNHINVDIAIYNSVNIGDKVYIQRTFLGFIQKVKRI